MVEVFTLADALGLTTTSLSANAQGVLNINVANGLGSEAAAAIVPFPAFDYEEHVRNVLSFDLDPQRKSGGEGVCRFFLKGFCAKGQACPYKHVSQATLNANAHKAGVVCKHYLRGLCKKGDLCEFLYCILSSALLTHHADIQTDAIFPSFFSHEYNLKKMPECWFFSKYQSCTNPECQYLHIDPNSKVKECPWYARGFCKHGVYSCLK
ncbi:UNVERIFIED_CONTAM: hypothetical protein HDU68_004593 [Siphonaria sp. JEL0065]|nr:hypothetical protein HDU68_004593 [Siphonaria sp. JEL0065]